MSSLTDLPEIGPITARHLAAVGIRNAETLREVSARDALRVIHGCSCRIRVRGLL
ncbi:MAG: TfoX/Sxy family protein [Bifidobacteriaceae bacterium]|nr:TfoX/Sxy family protein [Bifidobacteriaceae bacterium]